MAMGAGRARKEDPIDPMVGIRLFKELGDFVKAGEPLFTLYGKADADMARIAQEIASHIIVQSRRPDHIEPVISEIIT